MNEISLLELNQKLYNNPKTLVLFYNKNNIISELALYNMEKLANELNVEIYKLSIQNNNFEEPLPTIVIYENTKIKNRLYGFYNLNKTKEFIYNNYLNN